jgi:hypothetical protein
MGWKAWVTGYGCVFAIILASAILWGAIIALAWSIKEAIG